MVYGSWFILRVAEAVAQGQDLDGTLNREKVLEL